jgi:N-acetylmuramoyl-L-alanine amidase
MRKKAMRIVGKFLSLLLFSGFLCAEPMNKLQRLFHHRNVEHDPSIQLGKIVFYFSSVAQLREEGGSSEGQMIIFIPNVYVDASVEQQIDRFNTLQTKDYSVQVQKSEGGIRIVLSFDPQKIAVVWGTSVSIKNDAILEFNLYNKEYLGALNNKPDKLLSFVASSRKPRIVIDCGHGGDDYGAVGCNDLTEKELTLGIGVSLAQLLKAAGNDVFLTRSSDCTLLLDERTWYARRVHADMMVSIHANASANKSASGFEIFCLSDEYLEICGVFKQDYIKKINDLQVLCNQQSSALAHVIENQILKTMKRENISVVNRSVKKAVSQILAGSFMPAVLIEVGFVTNELEAALLRTQEYRNLLACGICRGIVQYLTLKA